MTTARLRLVFLALAVVLALPGALLVQRALASVALEREARERAVAERAFDELERALTEWLRSEEARPSSDYEFAGARSTLRERPAASLASGYFQIEADGAVSTPGWAREVAPLAERIAAEGARMESGLRQVEAQRKPARLPRAKTPEPPRAARLETKDERAALAAAPSDEIAAYDALSKLNTAAKEREQRTQQVYEEPGAVPGVVAEQSLTRAPKKAALANSDALSRAEQVPSSTREFGKQAVANAFAAESVPSAQQAGRADALVDAESEGARGAGVDPDAVVGTVAGAVREADVHPLAAHTQPAIALAAAPPAPDRKRDAPVRVVVDPLRGRLLASGELLLVRTAWIGSRGVRQGLALDLARLGRNLGERILATGALPGAALRLAARGEPLTVAAAGERVAFAHRFAEPFDALTVELSFPPFADEGARSVYWLAALFAFAVSGGLLAVYRMSAVALHFAERRSNFAAAVSHELKTPLTAIRLYAEMLRDGLVSGEEKRREYYGSITAETERLSRLINNVLEFSRLEKGARTFELRVGDAAPVVREAVELLRPHAAEHGLALEFALEDALPPVRFDRDALLQVVFNLIDNAVKYGRGEPARIEIGLRRAGDGVALTVRDHGPGVPREELARILEPFYRRGDELTRSAPGAGIGLALVDSLAQQMGGALRVGSAEGGGFEATLQLSGRSAA